MHVEVIYIILASVIWAIFALLVFLLLLTILNSWCSGRRRNRRIELNKDLFTSKSICSKDVLPLKQPNVTVSHTGDVPLIVIDKGVHDSSDNDSLLGNPRIRTPEHHRSDSNQANIVTNQRRAVCSSGLTTLSIPVLESSELYYYLFASENVDSILSHDTQDNSISFSSYVESSSTCSSWSNCDSAQVWQFSIPISLMENLRSIPEVTSVRVIADYNRHVYEVTSRTGMTAQELGIPVYPEVHWKGTSVTEARKVIRQRTGLKDIDYTVVLKTA